jgi:predicted amidohydrolase
MWLLLFLLRLCGSAGQRLAQDQDILAFPAFWLLGYVYHHQDLDTLEHEASVLR